MAAGRPENQWAAMLISRFISLAQQTVDTLPIQDLGDYKQVELPYCRSLI